MNYEAVLEQPRKNEFTQSFRVELVEFLMDKYSFNPISCVIRDSNNKTHSRDQWDHRENDR